MQLDVISWILLTLFIRVFADKRLVQQGSLVSLFQNVTADHANKDVNLYVNGAVDYSRIVTFTFVNGHISMDWNQDMADNYSKIFMDAKKNIMIANIDETYQGKFKLDPSPREEVELTILKTNNCTNIRTALNETTQKSNALPKTTTTERTPQKETSIQKDDALPGYAIAIIVLLVFLILVVIIYMVIMNKDRIFSWILCKKRKSAPEQEGQEGVPEKVKITSEQVSSDAESYQLMWEKPNDGGSPLTGYIIRYCEVETNSDGGEPRSLSPLVTLEILPSNVSYVLSSLKPVSDYHVQVQAVNSIGMSSESFIFKTNEETEIKLMYPTQYSEDKSLRPRNVQMSGKYEQEANQNSRMSAAKTPESLDLDSSDEQEDSLLGGHSK